MKFALFTHPLDNVGGAERVIAEQARFAVDSDDDVHIVTPSISNAVVDEYDLPDTVSIHTYESGTMRTIRYFTSFLKRYKPDVALSHYQNQAVFLSLLFSRTSTQFFSHVHGTFLWFPQDSGHVAHKGSNAYENLVHHVPGHTTFINPTEQSISEKLLANVTEFIERQAISATDDIFVDSFQVRKEIAALYKGETTIARPGVSQEWIDSYESIPEVKLMDEKQVVLSVCRLDPRKRLDVLIDSFSTLREQRNDVGLIIGGTGEEEAYLRDRVKSLQLDGAVRFEGFIPEDELPSYYKSADVFACPGWMSYGIVPLEAYAMRTPVAISSDAFANEVLAEEDCVRVCDPTVSAWASGIQELLEPDSTIPNVDVLPTWESFNRNVFSTMREKL